MRRFAGVLAALALLTVGCGPPEPVAVVSGDPVEQAELDALSAGSPEPADEASSLFLMILHRLLVDGARAEFGVEASDQQIQEAFDNRTRGIEDLQEELAERGVTEQRVMLEAELDVLRETLEEVIATEGADLDEAYRDFLATNSVVCMVVLNLADAALVDEVEERVEAGDDLDQIFEDHPDRTARLDMGCLSPVEHGMELAPVALDGEVGTSYARHPESGGVYVAKVTERDAPAFDDVEAEVLATAVETQGPRLFDEWAAEILRNADVDVSESVGTWEPGPETGDLPTVVPN